MRPAGAGPASAEPLRRAIADRLRREWGDDPARTPALDARLIVAHALGIAPDRLVLEPDRPVPPAAAAVAERLLARRLAGEPVARLLGEKEFWSLPFRLSPETLVPRPETETLVAAVLDLLGAEGRRNAPLRLVDLGTGSGAILLALLSELPAAHGVGIDLAAGALAVASGNAARLGLAERAAFVRASWLDAVSGPVDVIVANPPYIESAAIAGLPPEVARFDPLLALDGGPDGLDPFRAIVADSPRVLAPDGWLAVEVGAGQAEAVAGLGARNALRARIWRDFAEIERVVALSRRG